MTLRGKGRIIQPSKGKLIIYLPAKVHNDSAFPFEKGDDVEVVIKGKKLVIKGYAGNEVQE